jgi:hypothetical protein
VRLTGHGPLEEVKDLEAALPGYVWLDMPGKVQSVGVHELEFTHERERPAE